MSAGQLKIAFLVGEESGDVLGADLLAAMRKATDAHVTAMGVGGRNLQAAGLNSLFDPHEIALMGVTAVIKKLPRLVRLIHETADAIVAANPDCLIIIDSPDFTHRVAKRVRKADPGIPIINYVCPSVWAWRPKRAKAMRFYVDEVLAILPFEVESLKELDGPPATYVGHRLSLDPLFLSASATQAAAELDRFSDWNRPIQLLCLPGSRRGEIERHMNDIRDTLIVLHQRGRHVDVVIPTIERLKEQVSAQVKDWSYLPKIVTSEAQRAEAFSTGDVALASSGTVTLELALAGIPTISIYRTDRIVRLLRSMITTWTASLPNLIADQVVVPEYVDEFIRPGKLARQIETLAQPGPSRDAQLQGFDLIRERMHTDQPSGDMAAERVFAMIEKKRSKSDS